MKTKIYLRVAQTPKGRLVSASTKPNYSPLTSGSYSSKKFLPTVAFALELDIPDNVFIRASQVVAKISVPADALTIAADVVIPDMPDPNQEQK